MARPTVVCAVCGDTESGPWGVHRGNMLCELCLVACVAVERLVADLAHHPGTIEWKEMFLRLPEERREQAFRTFMEIVQSAPR